MPIKARLTAVITGALAVTALAGVTAFASPATGTATVNMGDQPSHMTELDEATLAEMAAMMDGETTIDEMHRQMTDEGNLGQMHREVHPDMGDDLGDMHREMAPPSGGLGEPS